MKDDYSAVFRNLRTERTDPTGRWSPIAEDEYDFLDALGSDILAVVGGIFFGIVGVFVLYLWVTI